MNLTSYSETYNKEPIIDIYRRYNFLISKARLRKNFLIGKHEKLTSDLAYSNIVSDLDKTSHKLRKRLNIVFV